MTTETEPWDQETSSAHWAAVRALHHAESKLWEQAQSLAMDIATWVCDEGEIPPSELLDEYRHLMDIWGKAFDFYTDASTAAVTYEKIRPLREVPE